MVRRKSFLRLLPPLGGAALFLALPQAAREGVLAGLRLSGTVLAPALFPVSVLAGCLLQMGGFGGGGRVWRRFARGLGLPMAGGTPLLLGLLGGFPLGAQLTAQACESGTLSRQEAPRLAGLSCSAGPAFLLGTLGGLFGSQGFGAVLLGLQLVSVVVTALLTRGRGPASAEPPPLERGPQAAFWTCLPEAIGRSAGAMVRLTGAVCFFQAATRCAGALVSPALLPTPVQAALAGALELTGGMELLSGCDPWEALPLAAALVGWGGLCVHLQAAQALSAAGLPLRPYLRIKALQSAVCLVLGVFFLFFKKTVGF